MLDAAAGLCGCSIPRRGLGVLTAFSFPVLQEVLYPGPYFLLRGRIWDWLIGFSSSNLAGRGGASIYGKQFEDELHPDLKFTGKYVIWLDGVGRRSGF